MKKWCNLIVKIQKKCNFILWNMIKEQLYIICFSPLMFEALSFHYTGKNRQKKLQMGTTGFHHRHLWCACVVIGYFISSPDVSVVATVWHTENWRNMRTKFREGAFLHMKITFHIRQLRIAPVYMENYFSSYGEIWGFCSSLNSISALKCSIWPVPCFHIMTHYWFNGHQLKGIPKIFFMSQVHL